jgi:hypothetical protein
VGVKFRKEKGGYKESILIPAQNPFDIAPIRGYNKDTGRYLLVASSPRGGDPDGRHNI